MDTIRSLTPVIIVLILSACASTDPVPSGQGLVGEYEAIVLNGEAMPVVEERPRDGSLQCLNFTKSARLILERNGTGAFVVETGSDCVILGMGQKIDLNTMETKTSRDVFLWRPAGRGAIDLAFDDGVWVEVGYRMRGGRLHTRAETGEGAETAVWRRIR